MVLYRSTILIILLKAMYNLWSVEDYSKTILRKSKRAFVWHIVLFLIQVFFEVLQIYYFMRIFLSDEVSQNYDTFALFVGIMHVVSIVINHWLITSRIQQNQRFMKLTDEKRQRYMQQQHEDVRNIISK